MPDYNASPYAAEEQALARRRQLAQLLQEQSLAPLEQPPIQGVNISPLQGIAKMVQALMAGRLNNRLDVQQKALNERIQGSRYAQALGLMNSVVPSAQGQQMALPPAPTMPMGTPDNADVPTPNIPPSSPGRMLQIPTTIGQEDARSQLVRSLAGSISSPDAMANKYGDLALNDVMVTERERRTQQAELARILQEQGFQGAQNALRMQTEREIANRPRYGLHGGEPGQPLIKINETTGQTEQVSPAAARPVSGSLTPKTVLYQGKPVDAQEDLREGSPTMGHIFLPAAQGLQDITGQATHYEKPPDTSQGDANRNARLYEFHMGAIEKQAVPIDALVARISRLNDTLSQPSTVSEALVAPELLSIMAGGQGSGIRMNQAELSRINGARSFWENLSTTISKFNPQDQKTLILSPEQKQAIRQLSAMVSSKAMAKQNALANAKQEMAGAATDNEQKQAFVRLGRQLNAIDTGNVGQSVPSGNIIRYNAQGQRIR